MWNRWLVGSSCVAGGARLRALWWPRGLGRGREPLEGGDTGLLVVDSGWYSRNQYCIVKQLHANMKGTSRSTRVEPHPHVNNHQSLNGLSLHSFLKVMLTCKRRLLGGSMLQKWTLWEASVSHTHTHTHTHAWFSVLWQASTSVMCRCKGGGVPDGQEGLFLALPHAQSLAGSCLGWIRGALLLHPHSCGARTQSPLPWSHTKRTTCFSDVIPVL